MRGLTVGVVIISTLASAAHPQSAPPIISGRSLVHAHNAYPEEGQWSDRIDRALAIGQVQAVIEQDIAYSPGRAPEDRSVVAHDAKLHAAAPSLRRHFFDRVRPVIEREHHRAVWDLLRHHKAWLTTASASSAQVAELERGPVLVLTENGEGQERDFTEWAKADGALLLFGSIPAPALRQSDDSTERARILRAGEWTPEDAQRLDAIVGRAHQLGLFVRFWTLNGHPAADSRGWTASHNFGSPEAVRQR